MLVYVFWPTAVFEIAMNEGTRWDWLNVFFFLVEFGGNALIYAAIAAGCTAGVLKIKRLASGEDRIPISIKPK